MLAAGFLFLFCIWISDVENFCSFCSISLFSFESSCDFASRKTEHYRFSTNLVVEETGLIPEQAKKGLLANMCRPGDEDD